MGREDDEGAARGKGPTRTCVVTREPAPREHLVRLVAGPDGNVVVDPRGRLPGRGVWVTPEAGVLARLEKRRGRIEHLLGVPLDAEGVRRAIRESTVRSALDGLSQAAAAGTLVHGQDRLLAALGAGDVIAVALADDAAPRTLEAISRAAEEARPPVLTVVLPRSREALGRQVGRGLIAALGVRPSRASAHLAKQLHRLSRLG